jgi:hypothetical protein
MTSNFSKSIDIMIMTHNNGRKRRLDTVCSYRLFCRQQLHCMDMLQRFQSCKYLNLNKYKLDNLVKNDSIVIMGTNQTI